MKTMNITILNANTVSKGDIDFSPIEALGNTQYFNSLTKEEVVEKCQDSEVIIINKFYFGADTMDKLPNLKYIGVFATGFNNVDIKHARERGIDVVNVPGYSTDSVAQLVFSFILAHATSFNEYTKSVYEGEWIDVPSFSYFPFPLSELAGKTLGIVGFGDIGRKVAKIGDAFGMSINIFSRHKYDDCPYEQVSKEELFRNADYLSLHCPLNDESANLVNEETLSLMKPTAFLINTARGGCVDSAALLKALNEEWIAGAGIDALIKEPMAKDEILFRAKNCLMTPHIGWASIETRKRLIKLVANNISKWVEGDPINVVNK